MSVELWGAEQGGVGEGEALRSREALRLRSAPCSGAVPGRSRELGRGVLALALSYFFFTPAALGSEPDAGPSAEGESSTTATEPAAAASTEESAAFEGSAVEEQGDPDGPLVTDRPGNGNAATTVPMWRFQIETGPQYELSGGASWGSWPTLFRFGVLPFLELRAGTGIVGLDGTAGPVQAEATDTIVGMKAKFIDSDFQLAASLDISLPTGSGYFSSNIVNPELRLLAAIPLPAGFGLLLNFGGDLPQGATDARVFSFVHVVNLGYTLPILDSRLTLFIESFGRHPTADLGQVWQIDEGAAFLINDNLQADFFFQHGLTDAATDFRASLGLSARF